MPVLHPRNRAPRFYSKSQGVGGRCRQKSKKIPNDWQGTAQPAQGLPWSELPNFRDGVGVARVGLCQKLGVRSWGAGGWVGTRFHAPPRTMEGRTKTSRHASLGALAAFVTGMLRVSFILRFPLIESHMRWKLGRHCSGNGENPSPGKVPALSTKKALMTVQGLVTCPVLAAPLLPTRPQAPGNGLVSMEPLRSAQLPAHRARVSGQTHTSVRLDNKALVLFLLFRSPQLTLYMYCFTLLGNPLNGENHKPIPGQRPCPKSVRRGFRPTALAAGVGIASHIPQCTTAGAGTQGTSTGCLCTCTPDMLQMSNKPPPDSSPLNGSASQAIGQQLLAARETSQGLGLSCIFSDFIQVHWRLSAGEPSWPRCLVQAAAAESQSIAGRHLQTTSVPDSPRAVLQEPSRRLHGPHLSQPACQPHRNEAASKSNNGRLL
jgi:hypothetical protein